MRKNIQAKRFKSRILFALLSTAVSVLLLFFFFFSDLNLLPPDIIFAQDSGEDADSGYDYILVIDESGSMKVNDPQNLRKDAAKLFIYLAEIMNSGNRAMISGFGEKTNVYAELTDISSNEDDISSAIDEIQSNQDLTDMKGALEKVKQILDGRAERNRTIVIFLTDGSLTIDDIPIESEFEQKQSEERPERESGRGVDNEDIPETPGIFEDDENEQVDRPGSSRTPEGYLEEYKRDLISLCYAFQNDGIIIHPIAFTEESEVEILEQIAGITGGICWKADEATDLRTSFIGILKNITSRFIKIEEQTQGGSLKGVFRVNDYVKELIVLALKNNFNSSPGIDLFSPSGARAEYDDYIEESIFKIGKVVSPLKGEWDYDISGDGIFVYEIVDSTVLEPGFQAYTTDAEIPLILDISELLSGGYDVDFSEFEVTAEVMDPGAGAIQSINMDDSGTGPDERSSDGVFSGSYSNPGLSGYYNVSFLINHLPTDSIAINNTSFRAYSLAVDITTIEPSAGFYETGSQVVFAVRLTEKPGNEREFDPGDYEVRCSLSGEQGMIRDDILLLDNGEAADREAGDGIYTFVFKDTSEDGTYIINYFIRDKLRMDSIAYSGLENRFDLGEIIEEVTAATEVSTAAQETPSSTEDIEKPEQKTINTAMLVIIISSSLAFIILIFLLIYFLIIRPGRRKKVNK